MTGCFASVSNSDDVASTRKDVKYGTQEGKRSGTVYFEYMSCPFYNSQLEAKANAQERYLLFTSIFNSQYHALCATIAKSTRDKDTTITSSVIIPIR